MGWEEKRKYPRVGAAFPVKMTVELGVNGSIPAVGETVNISRGGFLAAVDRRLPVRAHCRITFVGAGGRVEPTETSGYVRRVTQRGQDVLVGIEFDQPLVRLEVRKTLWKKANLFRRRSRRER